MDKPLKVTDIVKFLLSQASKDMLEPLVLMFFPLIWRTYERCENSVS